MTDANLYFDENNFKEPSNDNDRYFELEIFNETGDAETGPMMSSYIMVIKADNESQARKIGDLQKSDGYNIKEVTEDDYNKYVEYSSDHPGVF